MHKQLKTVRLAEIKPYENNPRRNEQAVDAVKESIRQCEYIAPIIVDEDMVILAGHTRHKALKSLGKTEAEVMIVSGLTEAQKKKYRLLDNKTNELASWDIDLLEVELEDIDFEGYDFGFDIEQVEEAPQAVEDDYTETDVEKRAKLGDLWQLGDHRLICGDSTDPEVVERLMGGVQADMVFTDPPWNVNYGAVKEGNAQGYKPRTILNDSMETEDFKQFMNDAFECMNGVCKAGAMVYVVMSAQEWGNVMLTLRDNGFHWSSTIIWNKDRLVLSRKDYHTKYEPMWYGWKEGEHRLCPLEDRAQSDVWDFERPSKSELHPTMKPVPLVAKAVQNSSHIGDSVLDLFGGSGTTLIACEQVNRKCYMSELDPHYCDVIIDRWEQFTGKKAVLLDE